MLGAEHRRERAAADACDDPARAGWFRDLHRGHYENASRLRGGDQPGEMEVVACAEVDIRQVGQEEQEAFPSLLEEGQF